MTCKVIHYLYELYAIRNIKHNNHKISPKMMLDYLIEARIVVLTVMNLADFILSFFGAT